MKARGMSTEHLSSLEARYGIDREVPQRILEKARDDQAHLEELAAKHSCELPGWAELAGALEERQARAVEAVERVIAETMELDDAVFGAVTKTDCIEVLHGLKDEFARALKTRAECARSLVAIAEAYREEGYSGSELVDSAVKRAVAQLRDHAGVPDAIAVEYVEHLAQLCGVVPSTASTGQAHRFPDLSSMFKTESGMALEEIANRVQQTALGLWPPDDGD
jgi:hypothetical protein